MTTTRDISAVFQNIDGDGLPTLLGDYVGIVEAPGDKRRLRRRLNGIGNMGRTQDVSMYFPEKNYRMAAAWNDTVLLNTKAKTVKVHAASKKPPTPRRDILVTVHRIEGEEVAFIVAHAINSAFAPKNTPTSFRSERGDLWMQWAEVINDEVAKQLAKDRHVIVLCDGNRSRPELWCLPHLKLAFHEPHGPDRIMVSKGVNVKGHIVGAKTGDGRVTHNSIKITLSFDKDNQ